jgi:PAS domain S-box-containing protein
MTKKSALFVLILLMVAASVLAQVQKPKDSLVIAISPDFQPFTFLNAEGKPAGMFVDIWRLWAQKTGKKIDFISSDWKTSIENLKTGKADIHSGLFYTPDRYEWMNNSPQFYEVGLTLFYPHKKGKISGLSELSGQTVAVINGTLQESYLKNNYPDIRILSCNAREELVTVTQRGKAKGFMIAFPVGQAVIDRMGLTGEFDALDKILYREKFHPGILKKNEELAALVADGFNLLSVQELREIEARWIPNPAQQYFITPIINLTPAEGAWIGKHKTIRVGMSPVFPPLKFFENGVVKGIEPDYLKLLSEYTGIRFEYVISDLSVMDAKVKAGEIDMFLSFNIPERLSYMLFTEPFMEFRQVFVARSDAPFISGIGSLKGKKVAAVKGVKLYDKLLSPYPDISVVQVDTMEQMFRAVSEFKADALISKTIFAGYIMQNYPNLKIAGIADLPTEPYLYAVRKDYPELVGILNKAISSIPKDKYDANVQKWFSLRLEYRPNWSEHLKWAAAIGCGFTLIIAFTLYWNRQLTREIEKRKQTEGSLKRTLSDLAEAQAISHLGSWRVIFGEESEQWFGSDELHRIYGYPLDMQLNMKTGIERMHPEDVEFVKAAWFRAIEGEGPLEWEHRIIVNGRVSWLSIKTKVVFDAAGKLKEASGIVQDISERKREAEEKLALEQQLLRAQKLESLGVLSGGIAHDFNNILAVIIGHCGLMKLRPGKEEEHIPEIEKAVERAAELCRQMLTYAGKAQSVITWFDMTLLINEMVRMLQATIPQNAVIKTELSVDVPQIKGDSGQLRQIVMNLILNASEAIGETQGEIRVSLSKSVFRKESSEKDHLGRIIMPGIYVCLEVTDNGCGMDDETMKRLFEPFYTTKFAGRGLGMSATLGIITAHNGSLQLFSRLGQGATFKIYLPVQIGDNAGEETALQELSTQWKWSGTILLAEDEDQLRMIAKSMLELLGFTVIETSNGKEALESYLNNIGKIFMVVTDIGMPVMDGYALIRELKKLSPELPIIISSGFGDASSHTGSEEITGLISKPYNFDQLKEVLKSVVEQV